MTQIRGILLAARHAAIFTLRGKRVLVLAFLCVFPLLVAYLAGMKHSRMQVDELHTIVLLITYQLVVPFSALLLGVAVLGDEIEGRTITYLFTRPVGRGLLYFGRLVGAGIAYSLLLACTLGAALHIFPIDGVPEGASLWRPVWVGVAGFWVYLSVFACIRTLLKRALVAGMFYVLIVEGFVSKMPQVAASQFSVWHHMMLIHVEPYSPQSYADFPFITQTIGPDETVRTAAYALLGIGLVATALGMFVVRNREYPVAGAVA
ncbi:MAG: ABC transporter permease [Planctomycetota bacterium]|jgi:ABC-type transport system involved in multi-copper enzyme maturation permease subunit